MSKINAEYFKKYCEVASQLLARDDKDCPSIKSIIRYAIRQASNHSSDLPGHDNKLGAQLVSKLAYEKIKRGDLTGLVGEHVVPVSFINQRIMSLEDVNQDDIEQIVKKLSRRAVITTEEDEKLKACGLLKKMPDNWDGENLMARYEAAGLEVVDRGYRELLKQFKGK